MSSRHDSHNQPSWGPHYDAPAPSSVPDDSAGNPSYATHMHYPTPPSRPPPISQQYQPPGPYAHPTPHYQQLDTGIIPSSSSGYHALPLGSQKTSYIPPAAKFVSGLLSVLVFGINVTTTGLRSLFHYSHSSGDNAIHLATKG